MIKHPHLLLFLQNAILHWKNEWIIIVCLFLLLLLSYTLGYRISNKLSVKDNPKDNSSAEAVQVGILSLLGLLLGFTFSMAITKYDERRQLTVEESNAISTAYFRAGLLPSPYKVELRRLLQQYIHLRIDANETYINGEGPPVRHDSLVHLQVNMWRIAVKAAEESPDDIRSSVIESLNTLVEMASKRIASMHSHVPEIIVRLLIFASLISMLSIGYKAGINQEKRIFFPLLLTFMISAILLIILDLDRPRDGIIQISQQSLIELSKDIDTYSAESAVRQNP